MRLYTIAGHTIEVSGEGLESLPGFDCFEIVTNDCHPALDAGSHEKQLLTIMGLRVKPAMTTVCHPALDAGSYENWNIPPIFTSEYENKSYELIVKDDSRLFRMKQSDNICLLAEISCENNVFQSDVHYTADFNDYSLSFVCWLLFGVAALSQQTVSIHSSAVMHQGKSILFLGESGTGKSTHTRLWLNHIPDTELLNDDSPFIRVEADGAINAWGSPWSGKTPCYKNIHTPIAAFVRLSQAPYNRIRRLTGVEAFGALLPSCPFAFAYDKQLSEQIYSILSHTLQHLPVYHLECLPNVNAAQLVYATLKQNNHL